MLCILALAVLELGPEALLTPRDVRVGQKPVLRVELALWTLFGGCGWFSVPNTFTVLAAHFAHRAIDVPSLECVLAKEAV